MNKKDFLLFLGIFAIILVVASVFTFTTGNVVSGTRSCIDSDGGDTLGGSNDTTPVNFGGTPGNLYKIEISFAASDKNYHKINMGD